ncbi:phage tail protein [Enterobacter cloacae]
MAEKYYSILTNRGKELEAQSSATGKPVIIKDFVVGDGNGQPVKPDPAQTKLVREVYRNTISALQVSPDQANQFIAQLLLAAGVGGFVVREVGLLTDAGELYSVANCAAIEKPENGVSVNLQYRLAVSETATIELKVATGDGLFLRIDKNLSEITARGDAAQKSSREAIGVLDATISRKGLVQLSSVTNSSSEALAATPKAVKAAYDLANGKYTAQDATTTQKGIVQLSSATDSQSETMAATPKAVSVAVKNLKDTLGTSAYKDIVTSMTDKTAGRVPVVGWMGLGVDNSGSGCPVSGGIDYVSEPTGIWQATNELTTGTFPPDTSHYGTLFRMRGSANDVSQLYFPGASVANGGNIYFRQYNAVSMRWGSWYKIYSEFSKPTPGEIGAVAKTGDTMTGRLIVNFDGEAIRLQPQTAGYASYLISVDSANVNHWYVGAGSTNNADVVFNNYKGGNNSVNLKSDGSINITATSGKNVNITGQVIPSNYVNFDARYYTKTESDGRFQPKGNYTPAGQAYTKAESDARFQKINTASKAANGWFKDTNTGMIIQWGIQSSGGNGTFGVTFPIAFPSTAVSVSMTRNASNDSPTCSVYNVSRTGFTARQADGGSGGSYWMAIGY